MVSVQLSWSETRKKNGRHSMEEMNGMKWVVSIQTATYLADRRITITGLTG